MSGRDSLSEVEVKAIAERHGIWMSKSVDTSGYPTGPGCPSWCRGHAPDGWTPHRSANYLVSHRDGESGFLVLRLHQRGDLRANVEIQPFQGYFPLEVAAAVGELLATLQERECHQEVAR